MAASTDLVASRAAALRLAQQMGCSGAHQHPDGEWMPCATMTEYEELVKKDKKNTVRVVEQRRRSRNSKGKNKRDWEPLAQRGLTSIDTITGGGLVGGSVKAAPWAPDEEDPDVFTTPRLARRRARQLGCIGIARRVSRSGNTVWTPCSNATDYAKRTGSTAFGRNFQRRRARRTLERAVAREVRRQLRRKKSLMETLYEGKALGRKLNRARVATTTPFNPDARDADLDMLVQEGTPWERPATPRVPGLRSRRDGPVGGWRFGPKGTRATGRRLAGRRIASRIDPAQVPENVPGDENFWDNHRLMERLTELAGYAQFEKLRRANDKLPLPKNPKNIQDGERLKPYQLARQIEPLLGIDPITGSRVGDRGVPDGDFEVRPIHRYDGARRFRWGNNSEVPTEMEHLPDGVLDRISRDALAEFDRRQETERLRLLERGEEFEPEWYVRGLASRRSEGLTAGPVGPTEQGGIDPETGKATGRHLAYDEWVRDRRQQRSGRRRAERSADRDQRRRDMENQRAYAADMEDPRINPPVTEAEINAMAQHYEKEKDQRAFERDMADLNINPPVTEVEIDEMAEYYDFAEATGGLQSVRGFKLTPEEDRTLSDTEKAAKYRKATLDAVGEEHRGKPVRRIHWVYGAPGSGKTAKTRMGHLPVPDTSEAAHTNPDDYKRFHKRWNFGEGSGESHQFSRGESAKTLDEALNEGMDVVVQGTGKDGLLMNSTIFEGGNYRNGRRSDTASVMHFLHVPDDERSRRIVDRRTDQRRRHGAKPADAMNVLDQAVKYIEEGRVDEAHIYDNSGPMDKTPPLVATFKDGNLVIYDEEKFDAIFNPKDHNGQPVVFRGRVVDQPQVTAYSKRDDPRRGKTYAERLREEGKNPGGFRKWDEAQQEKHLRAERIERKRRSDAENARRDARAKKARGDPASYRGLHTAPTKSEEGGDTFDSLTNMLPLQAGENNNDRVRLYGSSGNDPEYARANDEMLAALDATSGNPDQTITVYRAVPPDKTMSDDDLLKLQETHPGRFSTTLADLDKHRAERQINSGDWVSPSPTYAAIHGEGPMRGEYKIATMDVRAGDLVSEGNSLYEFGFDPDPPPEPSGLASRRGDEGESLQDAYRRHLKAKGIQTDGERAFEEQYGYELRSGDGDCYSASYRAAAELAEKGVDADGDPVTNVRVVVGSPVFPKVGERSGHAWIEYDAVKPPPPLMSSADRDHAKEQILALVEDMDLPPGRKQETIDSFLEAIDRANAANAAAPVRDVTMVRDYSNVRDGDDILEFDDMDRGRLEALKPDVERDVYYRAGEMEEVDIAGRFSPAEYEETQVGLFGSDFYDGDATFLTREQVDQHLEDMGIDGGLESKRTDDADAEDARLHDEAIEQLREIFVEAGSEQAGQTLDDLAYEMRRSPHGMMGGGSRPIKPENLEAIRELVEERDPEFMGDLVESQRIRETNEGYRRLTESGLDSGVGVHDRETTTSVRGLFDGHVKDGDPIILYHGGPVDLTGDVDYEVGRNDSGQWGPGIYTTASAFPAIKGWANPWQRKAEGGYDTVDPGYLHTTRWKGENPPRILDVMDPIPNDVLDEVVLPTIDMLGKEVADAMTARTTKPRVRSDGSFTGGGWKPEYAWVAEELDELRENIERKRDGLSGGRDALTGSETLLQLQTFLQTNEVGIEHGGEGWNDDGFIPSDRVKAIRDQINAAIKDLGYDVIKSHEAGLREMTRTDYMFLDPDMVEFVDVATTHSLGGFGNANIGEMAATVRKRATARREAAGLRSERGDNVIDITDRLAERRAAEPLIHPETGEVIDKEYIDRERILHPSESPDNVSEFRTRSFDRLPAPEEFTKLDYEEQRKFIAEKVKEIAEAYGFEDATDPRFPHPALAREHVEALPLSFFDGMSGNVGPAPSNDNTRGALALAGEMRDFELDPALPYPTQRKYESLNELTEDIRVNGFEEALIVMYDPETGHVKLAEGNHRLAAARLLGMESIPARMSRINLGKIENPRKGPQKQIHTTPLNRFGSMLNTDGEEINNGFYASDIGIESVVTTPEMKALRKLQVETLAAYWAAPRESREGDFKSRRFDQRDIGMEGVGPVRTGANRELVRDIELPNGNTVEVDASMAPRVKRMNDAGYLTAQAGSGNPEDYPEGSGSPAIEAGTGYISLYKAQLDDEKIDDLRRAAAEAGLSFHDDDVFFQPAVSVRTAMMADGTPYFGPDGIHQQSNALAAEELGVEWPDTSAIVRGLRPSLTPEENTDFYRLIDKRDEINPRLKAEHGGQISAEEGQRRWVKFEDALLGEAHDLSHYTALDASTADEEGYIPGRDQMEAEMNADPDGLRSKRDSRAERVARLADPDWDTYYGEETQRVADALGIDVVDPRYPHPGAVRTLYDYGRKENEVELVPIEFFDDMPGNVGAAASNDGNDDAYALAGEIREFESDPTQRHLAQQPQTELVKSVRAVGILSALIGHYDFETGDLSLGEGNHRLAAAREVGMTVVPIRFSQMRGRRKEAGARKRIQTLSANKWGDPMLPDGHRLRDEGLTELPSTFSPSDIGIPTHDLPEFPELKKLRKDRRDVVDENLARRNELRSRARQEALDGGSTQQEARVAGDAAWRSEQDRWLSSPVDEGGLRSRRTDALSALEEGRYHPQTGFPDPVTPPESRQPLWDKRGQLAASHLTDVDLMELETYHSLLGKYLERRQTVSDTYQRLWKENDIKVSGYPTWVTDRLHHRPLNTPTKTTLPVRYTRPGMEDPNETSPSLRPAGRIAYAEKMQAALVDEFFARHLGEDWRDTNPDARLMPDGTEGRTRSSGINLRRGLNYSETLELFKQAELLATHHDTFKKHWQKNFDAMKEYAKTSIAVRQVGRAHHAADAGEEAEFDLGVTLYMPGNDNFRGAVSTDHIAMVNMLEDMLLVSGHGPLSESQVELLGNASEIILLEGQKYTGTNTLTMDRVGDETGSYESLDTLPAEWHKYDEDAVVISIPMTIRRKVKRAGIAHVANHLTPEENDAIDAAFGTRTAGDSDAFAEGNVSFLINAIHETWAHQSAGYASKSLILQQVMARGLGWDDQKIADDLFHGVDTSGVFGHKDMDALAPSLAKGGITYSEIKERAAAVIESLGDSMLTNVDDRSGRIHIRRDSATGNWIAEDTTTGEIWEAPDLEQIEKITGLTAVAEDVARDEGISLEEAQEIINNVAGSLRPTAKSFTLGLTFRESAEPFEQLDRRIGLVLDDLDADSVAEEVRLGRELVGLRRGSGASLTPAERRRRRQWRESMDMGTVDDVKNPRDILFALKDVLPFTPEQLKDGATMAEARRIKKAYERVRAHRAARDNARHMVTALVYEHYVGDAFKAALAAERRTTAARLKEMGVETIPLYRGFILGKDDADSLLSALGDTGALYDDYMMPLTAWSTSKETAKLFGTLHHGANEPDLTGFIVRSDVSVDDIVGLSTHGFGCISEGECVVGHGERHLTIEAVY